MKLFRLGAIVGVLSLVCFGCTQTEKKTTRVEGFNREPLVMNQFAELPLGSITPEGWIREVLIRQKNGATGNLDTLYPEVMGKRNGWLGGDGDQWERGPYWIDGLLPLAYILQDSALIAKTTPWIEWILQSQKPDGYFGPDKDYPSEPGLQRDNCQDWWPRMVVLKVLQQYYSVTQDQRVIDLMTRYFDYQLANLKENPLDKWTFWARMRGGDNLMMIYWLYNITGNENLLKLGDLVYEQTEPYTDQFLKREMLRKVGSIHGVNLAQGIKTPIVYYQADPQTKYLDALNVALEDLHNFQSYPIGMFSVDEAIHGNDPTQGIELCGIVEFMFSLETMYKITGDPRFADMLEKVTYNALPTQVDDAYQNRQYFQQVNQIELSQQQRNFDVNHDGLDNCFGLLTGYPCCTSNMHQGWPKYVQNLWYATSDNGLAATMYAPSQVATQVADGVDIRIVEDTRYPFEEQVTFTIAEISREATFPFVFRIPAWSTQNTVTINGEPVTYTADSRNLVTINRKWKQGDKLHIAFTPEVKLSVWKENARSVERGPLVYALKVESEEQKITNGHDGLTYYQYTAKSPWNYALIGVPKNELNKHYQVDPGKVTEVNNENHYPWNVDNAPITIRTKARKLPHWKAYNNSAGPIPFSVMYGAEVATETEEIELIPYGCTVLRITEFPLLGRHNAEY